MLKSMFLCSRPENKPLLSVISALSLLITVISRSRENNKSTNILLFLGCAGVYCFRTANGALVLPILYRSTELSKGIVEARSVYAIIGILIVETLLKCYLRKTTFVNRMYFKSKLEVILLGIQNVWLLLTLLCMRPHNISLMALISLQELCLQRFMKNMKKSFCTTSVTLLYLWMGQAAYYYQVIFLAFLPLLESDKFYISKEVNVIASVIN